nr:hypothetical protein [Tanacetum cinerariifolium]
IRGCVLSSVFCQRYCIAFCFYVLILRFAAAFWLCVLLLEYCLAFCLGKTLPILKLGCVLCQDAVAFCLEDFLRFASRSLRFVSRLNCILPQDLLCFVSGLTAICLQEGKENGVNILKSIDEGPYQMGTVRETLAESTEGAPQFCPK